MLDEPDKSLEAIRLDPTAYERHVLETEGNWHQAQALVPNRESLGFLLFDAKGEPVPIATPSWVPRFDHFDALISHADPRSSDHRLLHFSASAGESVFALWAPCDETANWNLPASLRGQAERVAGTRIVLFAEGGGRPIDHAVAGFGLTPLQQRVVAGVVRFGSLRVAAAQLKLSYATVRETMADATRRMNLPNTPAVVRTVVAAGFGIMPGDVEAPALLADMLGISERQARVALLVSSGASRNATASAIGTTTAVIKKELEALFANFGIKSAAELSRLLTEVQALRMFARSTDNAPGFVDPAIEPSHFSVRPNGHGMIAWSDYGPASGRPVLIVHSNWCCRFVPRVFVQELQRRGWRPIAIDRPGFGGTGLGSASKDDPFGQAINDIVQLLDSMKIERIPIIARCGAQFTLAFKAAAPERVGPVILVSPTPAASSRGKRAGPVGAFKEAFFRSPRLIEFFFAAISAQFTFGRVEHLMHVISKGSPADEALCEDPQFIRDRFRALRPFTTGNFQGGVLEEMVISQGVWNVPPFAVKDWLILQGDEDPLNSAEEVSEYWRETLPLASIEVVPKAGRFMTSSHPTLVVDRLESAF
jgi:pimeloyl-ACP methyl ester carboxylesterase/DNA-binding CsgD family transcriptional regulator